MKGTGQQDPFGTGDLKIHEVGFMPHPARHKIIVTWKVCSEAFELGQMRAIATPHPGKVHQDHSAWPAPIRDQQTRGSFKVSAHKIKRQDALLRPWRKSFLNAECERFTAHDPQRTLDSPPRNIQPGHIQPKKDLGECVHQLVEPAPLGLMPHQRIKIGDIHRFKGREGQQAFDDPFRARIEAEGAFNWLILIPLSAFSMNHETLHKVYDRNEFHGKTLA